MRVRCSQAFSLLSVFIKVLRGGGGERVVTYTLKTHTPKHMMMEKHNLPYLDLYHICQ